MSTPKEADILARKYLSNLPIAVNGEAVPLRLITGAGEREYLIMPIFFLTKQLMSITILIFVAQENVWQN